jgi:replicative DNA helicase|tara:strand:+ start:1807 stop:3192 length:1386 start_codon:yes stop_codon:yes gene_type:complete
MAERIEEIILRNLLFNEEYYRKVVPFLKAEYYEIYHEKIIYEEIADFASKYDKVPTKEVLTINLQNRNDLTDESFKDSVQAVSNLSDEWVDYDWLLDATEKWCKDRAIYLALMQSIKIADGGDQKISRDAIPSILQEALAVSFDEHIGHDYIEQATDRYDFYHRTEEKIPFDLDKFNYITKGGLPNKTLNIALAGTGVGKSLFMCHCAGAALTQGRNVLYITCEMAEEKIAERIDANLLNVSIRDLADLPEVLFSSKVNEIARKTQGKLIIKEYPTASAHAGHFRALLSDLKLKKDFKPDIIFIDYLNICASVRYKGAIVNSYTYVKAIAEELRGFAVECNVPIISATQTTRSGYGNSDPDLTDTSESFGLPATADLMFALISTEELEQQGRIMVKQLKNRYNETAASRKFMVGIDRSKMKLYDVADDASEINISDEDTGEQFSQFAESQTRLSKFAEWNV